MKHIWALLGGCALMLGCKQEDTRPPSWQVVLNGAAEGSVIELTGGEVLTFTGDAQDDVQLGQAAFTSIARMDGFVWHIGTWSWDDTVELEGAQALVGKQWSIPDSVDGSFDLRVLLSDEVGQTAPEVHYTLHLSNPSMQRIQLDSIAGFAVANLTEASEFLAGTSLDLVGSVSAPAGLTTVQVNLESDGSVLETWTWENWQGPVCDLGEVPFILPNNLPEGETEVCLRVRSVDSIGAVANACVYLKISA